MTQAITPAERLANVRRTLRSVYGVRVGENALIYDLEGTVTIDHQVISAHLTIMLNDVVTGLGADRGNNADTLVGVLNTVHYHVTFRCFDADYDARNPKYYTNSQTWGPAANNRTDEASAIIDADDDDEIGEARDAVINEASNLTFRVLTALELAHQ